MVKSAYSFSTKKEKIESHIIVVWVDNEAGVLARVIGLFSGRGYNIESLAVAEVDKKKHVSRITIVTKGTPEVIKQRMQTTPHTRTVLKEEDIESVLDEFDEQFRSSFIRNKLTIDTSESTVKESLQEFVTNIGPFLSDKDRLRIQANQILKNQTN